MAILGGIDIHRSQLTFDYVSTGTGEVTRGRVEGTRVAFGDWLDGFAAGEDVTFAFEGCTGWRYVAEELDQRGFEAVMAEPADTAALKGPKKRAKTDRADAKHLRELLVDQRIPESWIPPSHVIDVRVIGRSYLRFLNGRRRWIQRGYAELFQHGTAPISLTTAESRASVDLSVLSPGSRFMIEETFAMIDHFDAALGRVRSQLETIAGHPGPTAAAKLWGVGKLFAPIIWAEMGDTRRFTSSKQAVRYAGLDITVKDSDGNRPPGTLSRQGSPTLRWALVEAAQHSAKKSAPDYPYYSQVAARQGKSRAALSVARKHARRIHHAFINLGDQAWQPI
jgi:transposase